MKQASLLFTFLVLSISSLVAQQKPLFEISTKYDENGREAFEEIQKLIVENYYYQGLSEQDLYWAAIQGMLRHVSPPQNPDLAQLWTDEEYEQILNSLKGVKVTLGFNSSFKSTDGSLTVTKIIEDAEAASKLQLNDRILRIDGVSLKGKSTAEVNALLDGPVGLASTLKVVRDIKVLTVKLTRETLHENNVVVTKLPSSQSALIELKKISLGVAEELEKSLAKLRKDSITSIVIDLRNNLGGVLNEGINIARLFMKKGDIVLRTQSRTKGITSYTAEFDKFYDFNVVVLINEQTASAAEIIASALYDHQRCEIVGKKSFGKGIIETTFTLSNDYRVKFITNAMYSPRGRSWQGKGLLPDYFVDQTQANLNLVVNMPIEERIQKDLHLSTSIKVLDN